MKVNIEDRFYAGLVYKNDFKRRTNQAIIIRNFKS